MVGQLLGFIMAHSALIVSSLGDGELLVPYIIVETEAGRDVLNFEAESQQQAVNLALARLSTLTQEVDAWSYSQDSLVTLDDGTKQDALFFKVWVRGMSEPLEVYQMYATAPFKRVGNIRVLDFSQSGLDVSDTEAFIRGVDQGIEMHPTAGDKWESWGE
jgi:hypothetical protein